MKPLIITVFLTLLTFQQAQAITDGKFPRNNPVPGVEYPIMDLSLPQLLDMGWSITNVLNNQYLLLMGPDGRRPALCNYVINPQNSNAHIHVHSRCYRQK